MTCTDCDMPISTIIIVIASGPQTYGHMHVLPALICVMSDDKLYVQCPSTVNCLEFIHPVY